jgi:hypothetical protein
LYMDYTVTHGFFKVFSVRICEIRLFRVQKDSFFAYPVLTLNTLIWQAQNWIYSYNHRHSSIRSSTLGIDQNRKTYPATIRLERRGIHRGTAE